MQLSDFFAPINIYNLSIFLLAFFIFDSIGLQIAYWIKSLSYLRTVYWAFGMGIFVLIWFLLHFFIPFWPVYVWISLIILGIIFIPAYIIRGGWKSLVQEIINFPYPLIFILIAAKPLFFLLSAPPYYTDELAYHFYSPSQLFSEMHWPFLSGVGLYNMIPKLLNTIYILMFSLSKTYVSARILHFLLVFSAIYSISLFIKKKINFYTAILYSFFTLLLSSYFLYHSTLGYVDAAAAAFANLFLVVLTDFLYEKKKEILLTLAVIFGMTIGVKYTILAFLGSALIIGCLIFLIRGKTPQFVLKNYKYFIVSICISLLFGGYWYIKNILLTGNPIFPFVFKCFSGIQCATGYDFFSSWSTPLDSDHFDFIRKVLFQGNIKLYIVTVTFLIFSIVMSIILRLRQLMLLSIIIPSVVFLEILLSKNISGFELRYFFHWVLLIPLILILPFGIFSATEILSRNFRLIITIVLICLLMGSAGLVTAGNIKKMYEPDFVPGYVRNYATRRTNLNQWIDYYAPQTNEVIKWCGENHPMQNLLVIDPSLIWSGYELRAFVLNCTLNIIGPSPNIPVEDYVKEIRKKYNNSYLVSLNSCDAQKPDLTFQPDPDMIRRHEANMKLICFAPQILKNLYLLKN